jgi:hypothetical protein
LFLPLIKVLTWSYFNISRWWFCSVILHGSIKDDPYCTSRKNSLELIELSSINKVSLVLLSSCSNIGSIRDDPYWTSRDNSLELIELFSINKVS